MYVLAINFCSAFHVTLVCWFCSSNSFKNFVIQVHQWRPTWCDLSRSAKWNEERNTSLITTARDQWGREQVKPFDFCRSVKFDNRWGPWNNGSEGNICITKAVETLERHPRTERNKKDNLGMLTKAVETQSMFWFYHTFHSLLGE